MAAYCHYTLESVDWSPQNIIAAALGSTVYLSSQHTSKVVQLCTLVGGDTVCDVMI